MSILWVRRGGTKSDAAGADRLPSLRVRGRLRLARCSAWPRTRRGVMDYVVVLIVGLLAGAGCMYLCIAQWHAKLKVREKSAEALSRQSQEAQAAAAAKSDSLNR